jgi:type 1 glutamine amidotransferase
MNNRFKMALALSCFVLTSAVMAVDWKPSVNEGPPPEEDVQKIIDALPSQPVAKPARERRVLIFSATNGFRHASIAWGKLALERMGKTTGAYKTTISDDPANFEKEALRNFDAVILLNTTNDFFMPRKKERKNFSEEDWRKLEERQVRLVDNLIEYVRNGGGLVGIHAATDSCYHHQEYGKTIGGYFNGHPWGAKNNVTIVVEDSDHGVNEPVFGNQKDFTLVEEIYQFKEEPYSRESLRILLHLDPERSDQVKGMKRKDNDYAVAWVQKVGEGRVFYTSIGHNQHIYWNPLMLKHYLAGIQFATGDLEADTTPSADVEMP